MRTVPYVAKPVVGKMPLQRRLPVAPGRQNLAFSGRGFMPDYLSDDNLVTMCEASRTQLENEGVYGREGMMPPAGDIGPAQPGQLTDTGSGGAGSFCTAVAYKGKG